jgi:hypothetical protein
MIWEKRLLTHDPWPSEAASGESPWRPGSLHPVIIRTLYYGLKFFIKAKIQSLEHMILRFGCLFQPSWFYFKHSSICTTGQVLKLDRIYAYKESGYVDIVRLLDIVRDNQYLYCTLYFFRENKITTVSQRLFPDDYTIWQIMENKEFDEIMSRKRLQNVRKEDDLLEFSL